MFSLFGTSLVNHHTGGLENHGKEIPTPQEVNHHTGGLENDEKLLC